MLCPKVKAQKRGVIRPRRDRNKREGQINKMGMLSHGCLLGYSSCRFLWLCFLLITVLSRGIANTWLIGSWNQARARVHGTILLVSFIRREKPLLHGLLEQSFDLFFNPVWNCFRVKLAFPIRHTWQRVGGAQTEFSFLPSTKSKASSLSKVALVPASITVYYVTGCK